MLAIRAAPIFALALAGALALAAPAYADATADLFAAAKGGTASEVRAALSAGADPGARDENNNTPLHLAAMHNPAASVIVTLIEGGADPGARNEGGMTPLHGAATLNPNPSVIAALIEGGADPHAHGEFSGKLGKMPLPEAVEEFSALSEFGSRFAGSMMPLHGAAMLNPNPSVITALIEGGADTDARNELDSTALHAAAEGNLAASVMVSRIEVLFAGRTPLHVAAANAAPSVVTALIEGGADPGARDEWGKTPFDYAEDNEALRGTDAYWRLNDGRFE